MPEGFEVLYKLGRSKCFQNTLMMNFISNQTWKNGAGKKIIDKGEIEGMSKKSSIKLSTDIEGFEMT